MTATRVALAGSTGSIGTQTLEVVAAEPEPLRAHRARRIRSTARGADRPGPRRAPQGRRRRRPARGAGDIAAALPECDVRGGADAMASLAEDADVVVNGVVGFAGLDGHPGHAPRRVDGSRWPTRSRSSPPARSCRRPAARPGAELVPVDSEHGAVHQCLRANDNPARVARLVLTASGGPFRGRIRRPSWPTVTIDDALAHPTWSMGPKITVDSSTLMNKGLEVIEAHELFGAPAGDAGVGLGFDQIDVVVHPQSIVHSMVEFTDAADHRPAVARPTCACRSATRWPGPIASPPRSVASTGPRSVASTSSPPISRPSPAWAWPTPPAGSAGRHRAWLSAANEVAVDAFLAGRIRWVDIAALVAATLDRHDGAPASDARRGDRRRCRGPPT